MERDGVGGCDFETMERDGVGMKRRILNLLVALDQLAYVLLTLGHGSPDETLSAALWRWELAGHWASFFRPIVDGVFYVITFGRDDNHCRDSYESERGRKQLPSHYR